MDKHGQERPASSVPDVGALSSTDSPYVRFALQRRRLSENGATPWVGLGALGTPSQSLAVMLDTGTVNTWVTADCCTSDACRRHRLFDARSSSSFEAGAQAPERVAFGPWGEMGVVLGRDVIQLQRRVPGTREVEPELGLPIWLYLAVSYNGEQFAELVGDGGLAIPAHDCEYPTALLGELLRQSLIGHAVASFYFDAAGGTGECLLGAVDTSRFDPASVNPLPLRPLEECGLSYLWTVSIESIRCAGRCVTRDTALALDTGSSVFKGGRGVITRLKAAITDDGKRPSEVHSAEALGDYPPLEIGLGRDTYTLTPQEYFLRVDRDRWVLGVQYLQGLPDELLVVGSVFLDHVYSVFVFDERRGRGSAVVLARPHPPPAAGQR